LRSHDRSATVATFTSTALLGVFSALYDVSAHSHPSHYLFAPIRVRFGAMPELAQELVDDIVDHLREDTASLRNCAVLSTSWTYRSQAHLFRSIAVQGLTHAQQLGDILLRSPRIAMHVQELRVYGGDLFEVHDAIGCDLPSLHVVKVDEVAAEARQPGAAKLQHFASAHMLHMRCAHFKDVFQLGRALLTLPCLLMLRFAEGTTWTTTSLCQGPPIPPFAWNLRDLDLRGLEVACATEFLKLLAHESSHDALLGLDTLSISSSCVTEAILRRAAPQLRELCIEHHEDESRRSPLPQALYVVLMCIQDCSA
jgi:hypothetical protein